jgi:hypothetical protein
LDQFCFSDGEAIHAEGREGRCGASAERPDKVGVRRPETRRAGLVWAKSFGLRLGRTTSATLAKPLDLVPNHHPQNDPI